jgi:transcription initiation factor TFIIIB Brf1 subunit/transcription initiation factor TFIIB
MDLKVIAPIDKPLQEFKTTDEFQMFYSKHKAEVDEVTTHKLNKMYKIDGYKITRTKANGLSLKRWKRSYYTKKTEEEEAKDELTTGERITYLTDLCDSFREQLDEIQDKYDTEMKRLALCEERLAALDADVRVDECFKTTDAVRTELNKLIEGLKQAKFLG